MCMSQYSTTAASLGEQQNKLQHGFCFSGTAISCFSLPMSGLPAAFCDAEPLPLSCVHQPRCRVSTNPWGGGVGYVPWDGIVIDTGTLPGSWYLGYNVGMNLVHETGHWCVVICVCNAGL